MAPAACLRRTNKNFHRIIADAGTTANTPPRAGAAKKENHE
jgi:hypothetical protein